MLVNNLNLSYHCSLRHITIIVIRPPQMWGYKTHAVNNFKINIGQYAQWHAEALLGRGGFK